MTVSVMSAWTIVFKGGPMMWPILLLSVIALGISLNRLAALAAIERALPGQKQRLSDSLRLGRLKDTLRLCEEEGVLGGILKQGILKFGSSRDLVKGAMEEVFDYEAVRLKQHMDILSLIINAAPLLGLLGTVNAMAVVFHAVQVRSNMLNPLTAGELSSGIWQALLTTAAGLTVGVLGFALYGFCAIRINAVVSYIQRSINEMSNALLQLAELKRSGQESSHEL